MSSRFRDRRDAGTQLAESLQHYASRPDVIILALPRGGVPIAYEVATRLGLPLDIFVVRKLGLPGREEFAIGAIASGGARILNRDVIRFTHLNDDDIASITAREQVELERRERTYRGALPFPDLRRKVAILVDDGLATGSSMKAAIAALQLKKTARVVVAVPVAPAETCEALRAIADEVVCARTPQHFQSVGQWYDNFGQTTDTEVHELLNQARAR